MDNSTRTPGSVTRATTGSPARDHAAAPSQLSVHEQASFCRNHAELAGDLNLASSTHPLGEMGNHLRAVSIAQDRVLDLRHSTFRDSIGLATLLQLNNAPAARDTQARLGAPSDFERT